MKISIVNTSAFIFQIKIIWSFFPYSITKHTGEVHLSEEVENYAKICQFESHKTRLKDLRLLNNNVKFEWTFCAWDRPELFELTLNKLFILYSVDVALLTKKQQINMMFIVFWHEQISIVYLSCCLYVVHMLQSV